MWHTQYSGSVAPAPHHITIDMGKTECIKGFLVTPRMDSSTNGLIRKYEFLVSDDGMNWASVSSGDWMPYCTEVDFAKKKCRYIKLISKEGTYASVAELNVVLDHSVPVGVEQLPTATNNNAVSRQYITMEGLVTDTPAPGLCVVRTILQMARLRVESVWLNECRSSFGGALCTFLYNKCIDMIFKNKSSRKIKREGCLAM